MGACQKVFLEYAHTLVLDMFCDIPAVTSNELDAVVDDGVGHVNVHGVRGTALPLPEAVFKYHAIVCVAKCVLLGVQSRFEGMGNSHKLTKGGWHLQICNNKAKQTSANVTENQEIGRSIRNCCFDQRLSKNTRT